MFWTAIVTPEGWYKLWWIEWTGALLIAQILILVGFLYGLRWYVIEPLIIAIRSSHGS